VSNPTTVAVNGAAGRMGQRIVALVHADPELQLKAALEGASSPQLGRDAGELAGVGAVGVPIAAELGGRVDVVIDFSMPAGLVQIADVCAARQIPLVGATTGLTTQQRDAVLAAAQETPLILAPSMSLAVNLAMSLVRNAAAALKSLSSGVDVEIVERIWFKEDVRRRDALGDSARSSPRRWARRSMCTAQRRPDIARRPRSAPRPDRRQRRRAPRSAARRNARNQRRSTTRDATPTALAAAKFLVTQRPGLYTMEDVLFEIADGRCDG
jgi:4-hydroxy-tetrahydrodipicolinate reductase